MNHLAAVQSGHITRTTVIGLRKSINADTRERQGYSVSSVAPKLRGSDLHHVLDEVARVEPVVSSDLHDSGLAILRNKRYRKRLEHVADIIAQIVAFRLVGYTGNPDGDSVTPVFRACAANGDSFTFSNPAWQSGGNGPDVDDVDRSMSEAA